MLNGVTINPKEKLKYLGVELSKKLEYSNHLKALAAKASKIVESFARTQPNLRWFQIVNEKTPGNSRVQSTTLSSTNLSRFYGI